MAKKKPKAKYVWVYAPKPTDRLKAEVSARAIEFVDTFLRPTFIQPPPEDRRWNYKIDILTKWHGSFFYFQSRYAYAEPDSDPPTFDVGFARLEFAGDGLFNLAYFRHTDKWWEVYRGLSLEECLDTIRNEPIFQPV